MLSAPDGLRASPFARSLAEGTKRTGGQAFEPDRPPPSVDPTGIEPVTS